MALYINFIFPVYASTYNDNHSRILELSRERLKTEQNHAKVVVRSINSLNPSHNNANHSTEGERTPDKVKWRDTGVNIDTAAFDRSDSPAIAANDLTWSSTCGRLRFLVT